MRVGRDTPDIHGNLTGERLGGIVLHITRGGELMNDWQTFIAETTTATEWGGACECHPNE